MRCRKVVVKKREVGLRKFKVRIRAGLAAANFSHSSPEQVAGGEGGNGQRASAEAG